MTPTRTRRIWIRIGVAALAVLLVRLSAATLVTAQTTAPVPSPATVPLRVQVGGTVAGTFLVLPDFGLLASVPLDRHLALEISAARMPAFLEDAPGHLVAQAQVRMPICTRLASRKSVIAGVTSISRFHGNNDFFGSHGAFVRPHAGLSFERPVGATDVDFRFDVQGIFTFDKKLPVLPRLMAAWVWHRRARR